MTAPTLWDAEGKAQRNHPDTSVLAANGITTRSGTARARVLRAIAGSVGMTDYEITAWLRMNPNTERPRRVELVECGWVSDSGQRLMHEGSHHIVWVATDRGREAARALASAEAALR